VCYIARLFNIKIAALQELLFYLPVISLLLLDSEMSNNLEELTIKTTPDASMCHEFVPMAAALLSSRIQFAGS